MSRRVPRQSAGRVLRLPAIILLATVAGLLLALNGDGANDWASWLLLAVPLIPLAAAWKRPA